MPSSEAWQQTKRRVLASAFALVAAYCDVVAYVRWHGWGAMMTGNVIFLGRSVVTQDTRSILFYTSLITCFSLGAMAFRVAEQRLPSRGVSILAFPFALLALSGEVL